MPSPHVLDIKDFYRYLYRQSGKKDLVVGLKNKPEMNPISAYFRSMGHKYKTDETCIVGIEWNEKIEELPDWAKEFLAKLGAKEENEIRANSCLDLLHSIVPNLDDLLYGKEYDEQEMLGLGAF